MTDSARKKTAVVRRPKRSGRKQPPQLAKTSPAITPSPLPSNPPLPLQTRSESQLDQPPRYSLLFPSDQISLPHRPHQPRHPPLFATTPPSNSPLPQSGSSNGFQAAPSNLAPVGPITQTEPPVDDFYLDQQRPDPEAIAHEALCDIISTKFNSVISSIDGEQFSGEEQELLIHDDTQSGIRGGWGFGSRQVSRGANRAITTAVIGTNYFAKANLYANSRLPPNLPPLQL